MSAWPIAAALIAACTLAMLWARWVIGKDPTTALRKRVHQAASEWRALPPQQARTSCLPAPIQQWLAKGSPRRALAAAEEQYAQTPADENARYVLAECLLFNREWDAVDTLLHTDQNPRAAFLRATSAYLRQEQGLEDPDKEPSILSPKELLLIRLFYHASRRVRLAGLNDTDSDASQALEQHVTCYTTLLESATAVLRTHPTWLLPAFHGARAAIKLGLSGSPEAYRALEPFVEGTGVAFQHHRELRELAGEQARPVVLPGLSRSAS